MDWAPEDGDSGILLRCYNPTAFNNIWFLTLFFCCLSSQRPQGVVRSQAWLLFPVGTAEQPDLPSERGVEPSSFSGLEPSWDILTVQAWSFITYWWKWVFWEQKPWVWVQKHTRRPALYTGRHFYLALQHGFVLMLSGSFPWQYLPAAGQRLEANWFFDVLANE